MRAPLELRARVPAPAPDPSPAEIEVGRVFIFNEFALARIKTALAVGAPLTVTLEGERSLVFTAPTHQR